MEFAEHGHDVGGIAGVEIAGRFVGQQQGGPAHQSTGDAQALLLAAREADRIGFLAVQQADLVEHGAGASERLATFETGDVERQHHVFDRVAVEQELVVLEYQTDVAAQIGQGTLRQASDVLAAYRDHAAGRAFDCRDQFQQGRFAGAGMPGQEYQLAFFDDQVDAGERLVSARITLGDLAELDHAANTASTNSRASKGRRSSRLSPTPM